MPLGELLRSARQALRFDQDTLAAHTFVSKRTVSRWENGTLWPADDKALLLVEALKGAPTAVIVPLAELLRIELEAEEDAPRDVAPVVSLPVEPQPVTAPVDALPPVAPPLPEMPPPPSPSPVPIARPPLSNAELRLALDAVVLSAAEEHNVLPRKLRAFGVELLRRVGELKIPAADATALVALTRSLPNGLR